MPRAGDCSAAMSSYPSRAADVFVEVVATERGVVQQTVDLRREGIFLGCTLPGERLALGASATKRVQCEGSASAHSTKRKPGPASRHSDTGCDIDLSCPCSGLCAHVQRAGLTRGRPISLASGYCQLAARERCGDRDRCSIKKRLTSQHHMADSS